MAHKPFKGEKLVYFELIHISFFKNYKIAHFPFCNVAPYLSGSLILQRIFVIFSYIILLVLFMFNRLYQKVFVCRYGTFSQSLDFYVPE